MRTTSETAQPLPAIRAWRYWALALVPVAAIVSYVAWLWVDVPWWDQWDAAELACKVRSGTWTFTDYWSQHNEHRPLVGRLLMTAGWLSTGWDTRFEGAATIALTLAMAGLFAVRLVRQRADAARLLPGLALLFFSITGWENWLWGWQLQIPLCLLLVLLALLLLERDGVLRLSLAILAAALATYSFGSGVLVWPVGLALCLVAPARGGSRRLRPAAAWTVVAAAVAASYLIGFEPPAHHAVLRAPSAARAVEFALVELGAPLAVGSLAAARLLGAIGAAAFVVVSVLAWRQWRRDGPAGGVPPGILFPGAFAIAAALLTGTSRGAELEIALASRYTPIAGWLWISLGASACLVLPPTATGRLPLLSSTVPLLVLAAGAASWLGLDSALRSGREQAARLTAARDELRSGAWGDREVLGLYPIRDRLYPLLSSLLDARLGPFRDLPPGRELARWPDDCGVEAHCTSRGAREWRVDLIRPDLARRRYRCLMALTTAAGTKLPDLRVVPLADDMVFRESLDAQSRIFRGHHGVFDEHGAAHFEVHAPAGVELRGTELQLSLQILADHAYLGIETICAAQPIRL